MNSNDIYTLVSDEIAVHAQADNLPVGEIVVLESSPDDMGAKVLKYNFSVLDEKTKKSVSITPEVTILDGGIRTTCTCLDFLRQRSCDHIVQALGLVKEQFDDLGVMPLQGESEEDIPASKISDKPTNRKEGKLIVGLDRGLLPPDLDTNMFRPIKVKLKGVEQSPSDTKYTLVAQGGEVITVNHQDNAKNITTQCTCGENGVYGIACNHMRFALKHLRDSVGKLAFSRREQENLKYRFIITHRMTFDDIDKVELTVNDKGEIDCSVGGGNVLHSPERLLYILPKEHEEESEYADYNYSNLQDFPDNTSMALAPCCLLSDMEERGIVSVMPCVAKRGSGGLPVNNFRIVDEEEMYYLQENLHEEDVLALKELLLANREGTDLDYRKSTMLYHLRRFAQQENHLPCYRISAYASSITRKRLTPAQLAGQSALISFCIKPQTESKDLSFVAQIEIGEHTFAVDDKYIRVSSIGVLVDNTTLHIWDSVMHAKMYEHIKGVPSMGIVASNSHEVLSRLLPRLSFYFRIYDERQNTQPNGNPMAFDRELYFSEEGNYIRLLPIARYGEHLVPLYSLEHLFDEKGRRLIRDLEVEAEYLAFIRTLHPGFANSRGVCFLEPKQLLEGDWMLHTSRMLERKRVKLYGTQELKSFRLNINSPNFSFGLSSGTDWFDLNIKVTFGKQQVSLQEIKRSLVNRSRYVQLGDGTLGILPEEWVKRLSNFLRVGEVKKEKVRLSPYQFNILDDLAESVELQSKELEEMLERKHRLQHLSHITPIAVPKTIQAKLRDYQQEGLNWLAFLEENQLGGCLADDMGLGKTLQTITFLAYLKEFKQMPEAHLVVAPTSLIFNWEHELQKFAPSLIALRYTGSDRKQIEKEYWEQADIVLTTYGTLINDIDSLSKRSFGYVILDEAQAIKNPVSKRYKAVRLLNCRGRLSLTGTPIENNTFDLYTQMTFLNPGLLGGMEHFRREFALPIDRDRNEEVAQLLSRMIHPFLLRRTKKQVATELPDKVEDIIYCEMGVEQRRIYEQTKERIRNQLLSLVAEQGEQKSQMQVLQGLMQLRQICNSPALIEVHKQSRHTAPSIKIEILLRKLHDLVSEHKVLVFSQFTSMLSLIADRLNEEGISYTYLDGSSSNRQELVEEFQQDEDQRVFLISLKAGGTGLNLTAADYVFLVDPWWNPAVENQAIDRCYRIGQDKQVMAYRMICKDSIEEKILKLQEGKREVSDSIIQTDLEHKHFDREQIASLFA